MKKVLVFLAFSASLMSCQNDDKGADTNEDGKISSKDITAGQRTEHIKECVDGLMAEIGNQMSAEMAEKIEGPAQEYCDCAIDKMIEADMSIQEMFTADEEKVMEVAGPCMTDFQTNLVEVLQ